MRILFYRIPSMKAFIKGKLNNSHVTTDEQISYRVGVAFIYLAESHTLLIEGNRNLAYNIVSNPHRNR